jgi:translin
LSPVPSSSFGEMAQSMLARMEAKDRAREEALRLSRKAVRSCGAAIRSLHRGDAEGAQRLIQEARESLDGIAEILADHQDVRYAGFVDDAEQEYAEARNFLAMIEGRKILSPEETGVELANYLAGLGDAAGELRRHILNLIRGGRPEEGQCYLEMMEEIYHLLMLFDYPDAITRGLRRKSDLARSMLERTEGDLTAALEMRKVAMAMRLFEDKLKG